MAYISKIPSGKWRAQIEIKQLPRQSQTFATRREAEAWALKIEREARRYLPRRPNLRRLDAKRTPPDHAMLDAAAIVQQAHVPTITTGVYFLIRDGVVVYVGQSVNTEQRIAGHLGSGKIRFDRATVIPCHRDHLSYIESKYILALRPEHNHAADGERLVISAPLRLVA